MQTFSVFTGMRDIVVRLDDANFLYCVENNRHAPPGDEQALIARAIDHPHGDGLDKAPADCRAVIVVDDATRPTPAARIIPHILERLEKRTHNITFVTAPGTHRPLSDRELEEKIGRENLARYPVVNLDYREAEKYRYIGDTELGTPLHIHATVLDADYKVAIGNIAPHAMVGWGGGAKILQPGVSGEATTADTHLRGMRYPLLEVFGNIDCRMRQEVDAIGDRIGLDFIANTVVDAERNILGLFCGHYRDAHRAGVAFAQEALCPAIPAKADIVVASAYPCNIDYWQGCKPLGFSLFGVKRGGTVIFLFDPPEGLIGNSPSHRDALFTYLRADAETIFRDLDAGLVKDQVGVALPLCHFQALDYANVVCVSNGLSHDECELLNFTLAPNIEAALIEAFVRQGRDAKVGIIPAAGETLVRVASV